MLLMPASARSSRAPAMNCALFRKAGWVKPCHRTGSRPRVAQPYRQSARRGQQSCWRRSHRPCGNSAAAHLPRGRNPPFRAGRDHAVLDNQASGSSRRDDLIACALRASACSRAVQMRRAFQLTIRLKCHQSVAAVFLPAVSGRHFLRFRAFAQVRFIASIIVNTPPSRRQISLQLHAR